MREQLEELRQKSIDKFKKDFLFFIEEQFVESPDLWKNKLSSLNRVIQIASKGKAEPYTYDELCKISLEVYSKAFKENKIDFSKLSLLPQDFYQVILKHEGNIEAIEKSLIERANELFKEHFSLIMEREILYNLLSKRIDEEDFERYKPHLDIALKIAKEEMPF